MIKVFETLKEVGRFLIVGAFSVVIDAGAYWTFIHSDHLEPENAKRLSFVLGALFAFFANRSFTFRVEEKNIYQPTFFVILYFISFIANTVSHDFVYNVSAHAPVAFLVATAVSTILNYLGQKFYVFRGLRT